jgi:hypothetical protein
MAAPPLPVLLYDIRRGPPYNDRVVNLADLADGTEETWVFNVAGGPVRVTGVRGPGVRGIQRAPGRERGEGSHARGCRLPPAACGALRRAEALPPRATAAPTAAQTPTRPPPLKKAVLGRGA